MTPAEPFSAEELAVYAKQSAEAFPGPWGWTIDRWLATLAQRDERIAELERTVEACIDVIRTKARARGQKP